MSRRREAGYALVALMATLTIGAIVLAAALPSWRYLIKNDREEELIFRGGQIADAIQRYQKKNGAFPPNLETLVKTRFLRKLYKDPMTRDGKWRLLPPGGGVPPVVPGGGATPPSTQPPAPGATTIGPIEGVASRSKEKSLRLFNGQSRYDQWLLKGDPTKWVIGKQVLRPGAPPSGSPGPSPSVSPSAPPEQ